MHFRSLLLIPLCAAPSSALAFTFESTVQHGCHERITRQAAAKGAWPDGATAPAPTVESDALAAAVPFDTHGADAWTVAMVLGVRDVDLRGAVPSDMPELAAIHNSMTQQDQHCLREADDDGSDGDARALASCRAFILAEVGKALGDSDTLDLTATEDVAVGLWHSHQQVRLNRYAFHLGRASHALQDSFSHGLRSEGHRVRTLFNYVEPQLRSYSPARDGHAHLGAWDDCVDDESQGRVQGATDATAALLTALAQPGTRAERLAHASAVLDAWLVPAPGCDEANGWCADEAALAQGCSSAAGMPMLLAALAALGLRRRSFAAASVVALTLCAGAARAGDAPRPVEVHATVGGSLDRGAGAFGLGASYALSERFALGADVEAGPWFDVLTGRVGAGTFRLYATLSFTWASLGSVSLRSAVEAGGSLLLFEVPGARAGSVGLALGMSVLKASWRATDRLTLEVIPDFLLDVPSLHGVPLVYKEYRCLARLGWTF